MDSNDEEIKIIVDNQANNSSNITSDSSNYSYEQLLEARSVQEAHDNKAVNNSNNDKRKRTNNNNNNKLNKMYNTLFITFRRLQYRMLILSAYVLDYIPNFIDFLMRIIGPVLVVFAWVLFGFYAYVYFICLTQISPFKPWSSISTYIGLYILYNMYYNHIMATFTKPGYAPKHSKLPDNILDIIKEETALIKKGAGFSKYCRHCIQPKPPRTHHCHVCKQCVLRMDHHCPWLANCVGYRNYRYFYLFLLYLWIGTIYWFCNTVHIIIEDRPGKVTDAESYTLFSFILASAACLAVGGLLGLHTYLVVTNQSTIEMYYNKEMRNEARKRGEMNWVNPYNIGWKQNFNIILGTPRINFPLIWMLPEGSVMLNDGMHYPMREESKHKIQKNNNKITQNGNTTKKRIIELNYSDSDNEANTTDEQASLLV